MKWGYGGRGRWGEWGESGGEHSMHQACTRDEYHYSQTDFMADFGTHRAGTSPIHQATRVAVVPVLVAKLLVCHCECAEFTVQSFSFLQVERGGGEGRRGRV